MTDKDSAGTAAELDALYWQGHRYYRAHEADRALASLRKQLDEARGWIAAQDVDMKRLAFERDEARAANAKKDAVLGMLRGIATRCEHDGNVYLAVVAEDIREALQYAALTPASQEAPASPAPEDGESEADYNRRCDDLILSIKAATPASHALAETEMLRALDRMASGDCEEVNPASPSPGLRETGYREGWCDALTANADDIQGLREAVIEECAQVCEDHSWSREVSWWLKATKKEVSEVSAHECAAAIRALVTKEDGA